MVDGRAQRAKAHHYVPQVYLRAWADSAGQVAVRRRDQPAVFVATTRRVVQETDLYTLNTPDGPSDWLEKQFAEFESVVPVMVEQLSTGKIPPKRSAERAAYAALLALQYLRTPDRMEIPLFPGDAAAFAGRVPVPHEDMARFLLARTGTDPEAAEVQGACDFANYALSRGQLTRNEVLDAIFAPLPQVVAELSGRCWAVEVAHEGAFITCDQPLSLWLRRGPALGGAGLVGAQQVRFPLGPQHLLVLHARHPETRLRVDGDRVARVNQHIASTSRHLILGRPADASVLATLRLRVHRPTLRFNSGPSVVVDDLGRETGPGGDIIHCYRPYDDEGAQD
jgi:hypothetical protein